MVIHKIMNSILLVINQSFKRRKKQYLFLSLTLFLSTLLFAVAINLFSVIEEPFDDNFQKLKASHLLLFFDAEAENYEQIKAWYEQQEDVIRVSKPVPYTSFDGGFTNGGRQIKVNAHLTEYIRQESQDHLAILNPDASDAPNYNEVWLPYHFSMNHDLKLGDTLQFQFGSGSHDFVISSFVIDPHFLSGLFNPTRVFMAPGAMAIYQPLEKLNNIMVGIQLKELKEAAGIYGKFLLETGYSGTKLEYQLFKSAFTGIYSLFSTVMLLLSLMIFLIALLILNGTLSSQIYADFRQIGIFKTLGFTPAGIRKIYLLKIILLSAVAIPAGLLIAHFSLRLIFGYMNTSTGLNHEASFALNQYLLPGLLVAVPIMLTTFYSSYKAGKVSALQAIQNGTIQGSRNVRPVSYQNLTPEIIMGIQFLMSKPLSSFLMLFSFSMLSFLILFVSGVSSSMGQIKNHKSDWGFMDADLHISLEKGVFLPLDKAAFLSLFAQFLEPEGKVIPFSYSSLKIVSDSIFSEERGIVYDLDLQDTGLRNLSGHHPKQADEIALCIGTARNIGSQTGDSIGVLIEGIQRQMKVCGVYQDAGTFGQGFRLHASAMEPINPLFEADQFGVALANSANTNQLKNEISSFFGEKIKVQESIEQRGAFLSMIKNLRVGVLLVSTFFILVISILIANDLNIHIYSDRSTIAKLKAIGFTSLQVRYAFFFKNSVLMLGGILTGMLLTILTGKALISSLTLDLGLPEFPFAVSASVLLTIPATILLFGYLSSWNAMRIISGIRPTHFNFE